MRELRRLLYEVVEHGRNLETEKLLSLSECSRRTGLSPFIIKEAIKRKELRALKSGNRRGCKTLISSIDLQIWRNTRTT
jgi:hypothetical protein